MTAVRNKRKILWACICMHACVCFWAEPKENRRWNVARWEL